jgi:hypothetical protein
MKQIHVNIGLAREGKKNLTKKQVFDAGLAQGLLSHPPEIIQSSTEPTYVAWFRVGNGIDENKQSTTSHAISTKRQSHGAPRELTTKPISPMVS